MPPVTKPPFRSPQAVSEAIKDIIKDKTVCELGCAEGDNLEFLGKYAKNVIGFEYMERRYKVAQQRGFNVVVGDYYKDELPKADVYYFWPDNGERDSEYLVQKLLNTTSFKGHIIIGGDTGFPPEIPSLLRCAKWGESFDVPFNEGTGPRESGIFKLCVIDASKLQQQCTLVACSPRSGSSCLTGSLYLAGLSLGKTITTVKDRFNQKGYFENQKILTFNERVLNKLGSSIFATKALTPKQNSESLKFKGELCGLIRSEFREKFFVIKDPRINILQNLYLEVFSTLNIRVNKVWLKRPPDSAAKSINRMLGVDIKTAADSCKLHHVLIEDLPEPTFELDLKEFIQNSNTNLMNLCYILHIPYGAGRHNQEKISNFVEAGLLNF